MDSSKILLVVAEMEDLCGDRASAIVQERDANLKCVRRSDIFGVP
jgi:hypothetical protein